LPSVHDTTARPIKAAEMTVPAPMRREVSLNGCVPVGPFDYSVDPRS
jgi:hypothetical protein